MQLNSAWLIKLQFNPEYFWYNLLALIHCRTKVKNKDNKRFCCLY